MYAARNKGADQTARMRSLICAFVGIMSLTSFLMTWLLYIMGDLFASKVFPFSELISVSTFLWLSLPGDYRVTDEALLAETT